MRYNVTITGDESDEIIAMLREIGAEREVDVVSSQAPSPNPVDDIIFYLDRINTNLMRITSSTRHIRTIDNKLMRVAGALERIADAQEALARIERDRRDEEILRLRK